MDALQIIALIFSVGVLLKLIILSFSTKSWMSFAKGLYNKPVMLMVVEVILAAIVLYYLLQSMTLVQIIGGVVLGALLTGITFAVYSKELMPAMIKILKVNAWKKAWLPILIWIIIAIWTIKEIFM